MFVKQYYRRETKGIKKSAIPLPRGWPDDILRVRMKALLLLAVACSALAQTPKFEVVAVKPASPDQGGTMSRGGPGTRTPGTWMCRNVTIKNVVMIAYDTWIEGELVGPGWTDELRFDIDAKLPSGAPKDSLRPMLREMLADRFGLKVHTQPKEVQGYELVIAKGGPKFREAAPESSIERPQPGRDGFYRATLDTNGFPAPIPGVPGFWSVDNHARSQWFRVTLSRVAGDLRTHAGKPIEDATGLKGLYDVSLYWLTDTRPGAEPSGPTLFEALPQQLGLRLQSKKVTIESIVVDHIERVPTEN
jgi:uncharacterized protein (TIGR03435 family)